MRLPPKPTTTQATYLATLLTAATIQTPNPNPNHPTQIHTQLITTRNLSNPLLLTQLINLYAKSGQLTQAILTFNCARKYTNVVTWTSLIAHLTQYRHPFEAFSLFSQLKKTSTLSPNPHTFSAAFHACAQTGVRTHGSQVHALGFKHGAESSVFVASAIADMYAKCGDMAASRKVFDEMPQRNLVSWNALMVGYVRNKLYRNAIFTFQELVRDCSLAPDQVSFSSTLSACANAGELGFGQSLHAHVLKLGLEKLVYVKNSLVDMYSKCGCFSNAVEMFDPETDRDVVAWNILMMGWVHNDQFGEACSCFRSVMREGILPDEASFSTVLHALVGIAVWAQGATIHALIVKSGFAANRCVGSSLITMYAKCGTLLDAYRAFEETKNHLNIVSWTAMIAAFQQHGHGSRVIALFNEMLEREIEPDYITFVCVLSACSHNGLVEEGLKYLNSMSQTHRLAPGNEHYACVVDMLGRAGCLDDAKQFIDTMPVEPDASVWGALLGACRNCEDLELGKVVAQKLFEMEPDNPGNYVLLSNMYASYGRLEEAKEVRRLMSSNGVKKETGCSWIDIGSTTHVFTVHDRSHRESEKIYAMLRKLEELVREKGYVADARCAVNDMGEYKEQNLWCHSERLALAFGLISLPVSAPICIKKNLRTCGDCHTVMKIISGIIGREIVLRDTNRFHHFAGGLCSCGDYW
ncbi:putative pentatricopeptide repeat-containing protein At5g52630 [Typha latifolia]|uniref:putative pentatricopeptide repeat-containing protein At5g52630 n=1 Tax=Typha latifolia TaxID=4733 RepID=UPI003C2E3596